MKIKYLTLFENYYNEFKNTSIIKNAISKGLVDIEVIDLKGEVTDGRVDGKIVGGGSGNLIRYDVVSDALNKYKSKKSKVILVTPKGKLFNQDLAIKLSKEEELIFVCPHFEGIDERIMDEVDYAISIGDYILTGGELASQVISDSIIRLIDGVINKSSLDTETFDNNLLEYPQYTFTRVYEGEEAPAILFTGNHEAIRKWRLKESLKITKTNRSDLLENRNFTKEELKLLKEIEEDEKNPKWMTDALEKAKKFM